MKETLFFDHWSLVPDECWLWPNFTPKEMACKGTGSILINRLHMDRLQAFRTEMGEPFHINSAYRSPSHNRRVGGARKSLHLKAVATDISQRNHDPRDFDRVSRRFFNRSQFYPRLNFTHVDNAPTNGWGARFNG